MKRTGKCFLSMLLAASMTLGSASASISANEVYAGTSKNAQKTETKKGKYISDVYIAYGKTESDAANWLTANGWEPISGNRDFNEGKKSPDGKSVAAVMGIRRTDEAKEAITDMAVMNMQGGYSFSGYEEILEEKRAEIDDFIYSFLPTIEEYRANFNGEGSEMGQKRAELTYELLNKFYDGGAKEKYRKNDTGLPLGDLFLDDFLQEGAGDGSGDLEQIILEGSGSAVTAVENALALAADTSEDSWLDRLQFLTMDELTDNVEAYIPATEGQDVAPSAVMNYYYAEYGDISDTLSEQWDDVHDNIQWYEEFRESYDLNMHADEDEEEYTARYDDIMKKLSAREEDNRGELEKYTEISVLKNGLDMVSYPGEWGETLCDFFNPEGNSAYAGETASYLPMAVALSEGQRSAVSILPLGKLLQIGFLNEDPDDSILPEVDDLLEGCESISVYSGVNRGIFRDGVALTSEALSQAAKGEAPDVFVEVKGMNKALYIGLIVTGAISIAIGAYLLGSKIRLLNSNTAIEARKNLRSLKGQFDASQARKPSLAIIDVDAQNNVAHNYDATKSMYDAYKAKNRINLGIIMGSVMMAVGAVLIADSIIENSKMLSESRNAYYNKKFDPIPTMIVDENDIVSYVEEDGEMKRNINLDQYAYYEAVKCNRQEVGELGKWQKGVSDYGKKGCGDIADLNADQGLEWLALYTARAYVKGAEPILADSLKLAFGKENKPDPNTPSLHYFCNLGRADLADRAYCYSNDKGQMYFSWQLEKAA